MGRGGWKQHMGKEEADEEREAVHSAIVDIIYTAVGQASESEALPPRN